MGTKTFTLSKEYHKGVYLNLLTSGRLNDYLADIEEQAQERFERIVEQMKQNQGITEQLKENNPIKWTGTMNCVRQQANEIFFAELIFN